MDTRPVTGSAYPPLVEDYAAFDNLCLSWNHDIVSCIVYCISDIGFMTRKAK